MPAVPRFLCLFQANIPKTKDEIAALRAGVEAAIKAFDEDYAARKAAKGDS